MTKPKNPNLFNKRRVIMFDQWDYRAGYAAGLADGEMRMARALRKVLRTNPTAYAEVIHVSLIKSVLTARLRKGKGK